MDDPSMRMLPIGPEEEPVRSPVIEHERRRRWLIRLMVLAGACCVAFGLTTLWLTRLATPLAIAEADSQATSVVRAHFAALERGDFRTAYGQFSSEYRERIPFEIFHGMMMEHWRLLRGKVIVVPQSATPDRVVLEIGFSGEDGSTLNAEFTLVHELSRWWINNVRWGRERAGHLIQT
ncbi:MAG: DUF4864 domain-containing protein [Acidobacteriota bacterium]|nr:DUF4864 domain-containing protein [Acidobacteriota bacterium]